MSNHQSNGNHLQSNILKKFFRIANHSKSIIKSFYKTPRYNDEPLLYQYNALINLNNKPNDKNTDANEWGGGASFNQKKAMLKALGEGFERYCIGTYNKSDLLISPINTIKDLILDPRNINTFSSTQKIHKDFSKFFFDESASFQWIKGYLLGQNKKCWIPAQLVYIPYNFDDEPIIQFPITTGAALGTSLENAIVRGICEIIERDSFMIHYLNKISPFKIDLLHSGKKYKDIYIYFQRYNLELMIFDLTIDLVPIFMAIILDKTGTGPAISIGLKCSFSIKEAILGAIEEAQQSRPWLRDQYASVNKKDLQILVKNKTKIDTPLSRGLYWYDGRLLNSLNFWLKSNKSKRIKIPSKEKGMFSSKKQLQKIYTLLNKKGYKIYYVDITQNEIKKEKFFVVKVIIPDLIPLYLIEAYPYLGNRRLLEIPKSMGIIATKLTESNLNTIPHPFL